MEGWPLFLLFWSGAMGVLGYWVAVQKRRPGEEGAALGAIFGPFGVLIEALLPNGEQRPRDRRRPSERLPDPEPLDLGEIGLAPPQSDTAGKPDPLLDRIRRGEEIPPKRDDDWPAYP